MVVELDTPVLDRRRRDEEKIMTKGIVAYKMCEKKIMIKSSPTAHMSVHMW
jgi:hypothetical protein